MVEKPQHLFFYTSFLDIGGKCRSKGRPPAAADLHRSRGPRVQIRFVNYIDDIQTCIKYMFECHLYSLQNEIGCAVLPARRAQLETAVEPLRPVQLRPILHLCIVMLE